MLLMVPSVSVSNLGKTFFSLYRNSINYLLHRNYDNHSYILSVSFYKTKHYISTNISGDISVMPLLAHSPDHKPPTWCQQNVDDLPVSLEFEMDFNPDLTLYVSAQDKELIHLHLMVTSVFLFGVLAIVIIAFLIRTMTGNRKKMDDRGDHHIIPMTQFGEK